MHLLGVKKINKKVQMCAFWKGGANIWQAILKNLILLSFTSEREPRYYKDLSTDFSFLILSFRISWNKNPFKKVKKEINVCDIKWSFWNEVNCPVACIMQYQLTNLVW